MREYNEDDISELNADQWQIELLALNPEYTCWGPYEDYMCGDGSGWDKRSLFDSWESFGPWELDELNECVNFYFKINRENKKCSHCDSSGYSPEAKVISDAWYDFEKKGTCWHNKITQDEVQALVDDGRLWDFTRIAKTDEHRQIIKKKVEEGGNSWLPFDNGYIPTADEINQWSANSKGVAHDCINKYICIEQRCKRLGIEKNCPHCESSGYIYTADKAHVCLVLWWLHPRKGCSKGIEIKHIQESDLPAIYAFLNEANNRNQERFSKILTLK